MSGSDGGGYFFHSIQLGYAIVIAIGLLVIISTFLLIYFYCCYRPQNPNPNPNPNPSPSPNPSSTLPRILFIPEIHDPDDVAAIPGLDPSVIASYPKFAFSKPKDRSPAAAAEEEEEYVCSICLYHYREGEMLRMLPDCRHFFHLRCVDTWLRLNPSCPVCRNSPLPTPVPTPLSELVPLSHYPADRRRR